MADATRFVPLRFDSTFRVEAKEWKTLNFHRIIFHVFGDRPFSERDFEMFREELVMNVSVSSLKGLGFGIVFHDFDLPEERQYDMVQNYSDSRGTCQWVVVLDSIRRVATGIHMWMPGRTTPVFEDILHEREKDGWTVANKYKTPPGFYRWSRVLQSPWLLLEKANRPWLPATKYQPPYDNDVF